MDTNMEVNFSNTNPVAETLRLQPPSWLVLTQSGISINLSSGEVIIPENLELSAASREFWNSVSNLAKTRISEMRLGTDSAIRILEDIKSAINHAGRSYLLEVEGNLISLITINLRQQDRRIAELETQLAAEKETWRCFHCGFETANQAEAEAHFGDRDDAEEFKPLCRWWASMSAEERGETLQDTIEQLNSERDENAVLRSKIEGLEYRVHGIASEIKSFKPFRDCESIHQVFHVYDSMEGRMLVAEEKLADRDAQLKAAREAGTALLDALEYCHHCGEQLALDEPLVSHCESCPYGCDDHDEPECTPIYVLHDRLRKALAALDGEKKGDIDERN